MPTTGRGPRRGPQRDPQLDQPPSEQEAQRAQTERAPHEARRREPAKDRLQHD